MERLIHWLEIPVTDIKRAMRFYSSIFDGLEFQEIEEGALTYALFLCEDIYNNGALVKGEQYRPSTDGVLVYLNGGDDVENILSKVSEFGGTILMNKTFMPQFAGYVGIFIDTEGNRIAVHSLVPQAWEKRSG